MKSPAFPQIEIFRSMLWEEWKSGGVEEWKSEVSFAERFTFVFSHAKQLNS